MGSIILGIYLVVAAVHTGIYLLRDFPVGQSLLGGILWPLMVSLEVVWAFQKLRQK